MRKKIFSWLAMFMACLLFGGMLTPIANAAVKEENVYPPEHDGYIALSQYVQHVEDNIFKVQLTLETYAQSTTADIVMVIDASENMILRQEGTKTYFENALDAVYRSAEIWLSPGKNPLDAKSANRNRLWVIFYNGRAYDIKSNVIASGNKNSSVYCYISDESFSNPKSQDFAGKDTGIAYRSFSDMRSDLDGVANVVRSKSTLITTSPGAFNNDIKAYQERYTAAGLAAAYDVFADYSKTENIKTESNRKILYLLSNGPDYERDDVHLAGTGAPIATISSSRIPQEGSMRMEALFMAKALKLQMHSYGTGTETSLKTAAKQIADSEGNSYEFGVIKPPSSAGGLGGAPAYSPLSLDAHRVVIDPPDVDPALNNGSLAEKIYYIDSSATASGVMESHPGAIDSHPYVGNRTLLDGVNGPYSGEVFYPSSPIAHNQNTDPFFQVNTLVNAYGGGASANVSLSSPHVGNINNSGLNQWGVVTNGYNGGVVTNGGNPGNPPLTTDVPPTFPNPTNNTGAWGAGAFNGVGHFEYQMFANTAPYHQGYQAIQGADGNRKPTDFSSTSYYLSALNSSPNTPPAMAFETNFTNTHYDPFTAPDPNGMPASGMDRRPLDGYNYQFTPATGTGASTGDTYVYTYADAQGGANEPTRPATISSPNVGPDNVMPLKASYERIAGNGFVTNESGGMSVEIWSVGLFAGEEGDPEGDPANPIGPQDLGQGLGNRMYSMGTGYGTLDATIRSIPGDTRWEQGTSIAAPTATAKMQYYTDYTGYTYGNHTRPTHIDLHNEATGVSLTTDPGGANYGLNYQFGYGTTQTASVPSFTQDVHASAYISLENQEVALFSGQGLGKRTDSVNVNWNEGNVTIVNTTSLYGYPRTPSFGVSGYNHPVNDLVSTVNSGSPAWHITHTYQFLYSNVNWSAGTVAENGVGAAFSYIPPNPVLPAAAQDIQAHYSPNIGVATAPVAPATNPINPGGGTSGTLLLNTLNNDYVSNGDGGSSTAPTWFNLIDWHETTGAVGTTTQNDDSKGNIPGKYTVPNKRHNIWSVTTASAGPLTGPGSIPRDHLIYNGTGVTNEKTTSGNEKRSELQQHLWAISGVQTSDTVPALTLKDPAGFDPDKPWQNKVAYYWSKQTFLTTARMRLDDSITRVSLTSETEYGPATSFTKYPFVGLDVSNARLNSKVEWRYPWTHAASASEGSNSINRDFQNFYEYAGFNYDFSAYQTALTQTLGSLRWNHPLETYDAEDHMPVVKMLKKNATNTKKLSIYDIDPDEHDQYDRLVRVFEDLTYDFYRVSNKGGRAIVQLSEYFDLYKMPGIPEFEYYVNAKIFPFRYRKKMGGTASYNSGDKKMTWTFDQGVYAGVRYQLSFYVRMNRETDPTQKYPFQVNSYLDRFNFKSMVRYSGRENNNRHIVTKNFPSSFVSGIKGINDIASNVVIMNDYTPNTIDGSGNVLSSMGNGSGSNTAAIGSAPGGGGAALQKTVPIYTASVTPAPKKLIDEGVDEGTEEVPVTGVFGVAAVVVVGGLLVVAIVIKRRSTVDR